MAILFLIEEGQLGYMTPANKLSAPHFFLTTLDRLAETSIIAMQRGGFVWDGDDNYSISRDLQEVTFRYYARSVFTNSHVRDRLASGTDEEIAESLKAALPQWRKIKGIEPDPLRISSLWVWNYRRLISYRVMPMLSDILVWAAVKKNPCL